MQISHLPVAFLVRPLLRTSLFEKIGGKPVTDNNRLIDYTHRQAQIRISKQNEEKRAESGRIDLLSHIAAAEDKKTGLRPTLPDLGCETLNIMLAGADPFSGTLAAAFFYLVHNPDAVRKATDEVR